MSEAGSSTLEERLSRLEAIVRRLESDDLELNDALALFEEAVGHLRGTEALLESAQLKVDEMVGALDRSELRAVEHEDAEADPAAADHSEAGEPL